MRIIGGRLLEVCDDCGKIVRVDKPFFGSIHFCTTPDEREKYAKEIRLLVKVATHQLEHAKD